MARLRRKCMRMHATAVEVNGRDRGRMRSHHERDLSSRNRAHGRARYETARIYMRLATRVHRNPVVVLNVSQHPVRFLSVPVVQAMKAATLLAAILAPGALSTARCARGRPDTAALALSSRRRHNALCGGSRGIDRTANPNRVWRCEAMLAEAPCAPRLTPHAHHRNGSVRCGALHNLCSRWFRGRPLPCDCEQGVSRESLGRPDFATVRLAQCRPVRGA